MTLLPYTYDVIISIRFFVKYTNTCVICHKNKVLKIIVRLGKAFFIFTFGFCHTFNIKVTKSYIF